MVELCKFKTLREDERGPVADLFQPANTAVSPRFAGRSMREIHISHRSFPRDTPGGENRGEMYVFALQATTFQFFQWETKTNQLTGNTCLANPRETQGESQTFKIRAKESQSSYPTVNDFIAMKLRDP